MTSKQGDAVEKNGILSIVIPIYNEKATLEQLLQRVSEVDLPKEVVCVDDGSTDGTRDLLPGLKDKGLIDQIILHERNAGKGAALKTGFAAATGEYVVVQDADLEYDPLEIPGLLKPVLDGKADVVFGSRFAGGDAHRVLFFWHYVANRTLTLASNMFTNLNLTDMETCYKLFRREVLTGIDLKEKRFGVEPEITAKVAAIKDIRIYECGISYSGRTYAEGKKIGFRDAVRAMWCIVKYNMIA